MLKFIQIKLFHKIKMTRLIFTLFLLFIELEYQPYRIFQIAKMEVCIGNVRKTRMYTLVAHCARLNNSGSIDDIILLLSTFC